MDTNTAHREAHPTHREMVQAGLRRCPTIRPRQAIA